ncbi:MAG: hypothetical protein HZB56_19750 [Deltaproteobacteria bacterium]|nr:hypothetical protein [Deltaproteobacteria bacterium]
MREEPLRATTRALAGLALAAAGSARGGVTGNVEVQAQATQNVSQAPGGPSQVTAGALLLESLSLHYAGLPFGPAVAVVAAGGSFSHVDGWYGRGLQASGQVVSFDASLGFLPRRAVPLRLYAGGSYASGTGGLLARSGAGPSLLYGGSVNLEPGRIAPGLRLDASESRSSRPGLERLSDVQRRLVATAYDTWRGQSLQLTARVDTDHRQGAGDIRSRGLTLLWSSPFHQTTVLASEVRRTLAVLGGITSDRQASASSEQRWSPTLATQQALRLSEAGAGSSTGRLGEGRASFTWHRGLGAGALTFSGGASAGSTRSTGPGGDGRGESWAVNGRAAYGRPLGPLTASVAAGAATSACACRFGTDGQSTLLDATASLGLQGGARGAAQADYTLVRALAPLARGGDRLENHARLFGRLALTELAQLTSTLAWDDGVRELLDITRGRATSLHERALSGSLGAATRLGHLYPSAEVRHARNAVVTDGSLFVAGRPTLVRSVTSALAGLTWSPRETLGLQGQVQGAWTQLQESPDLTSLGASLALTWRLGRLTASLQYQAARNRQGDDPATFQQSIRAVLTRPFEL